MNDNNSKEYHKIIGLIRMIKNADARERESQGDDPVKQFMAMQYRLHKNSFIKELLAILIQSDYGVPMFDNLIQQLLAQLHQPNKNITIASDLEDSLKGLSHTLAA